MGDIIEIDFYEGEQIPTRPEWLQDKEAVTYPTGYEKPTTNLKYPNYGDKPKKSLQDADLDKLVHPYESLDGLDTDKFELIDIDFDSGNTSYELQGVADVGYTYDPDALYKDDEPY